MLPRQCGIATFTADLANSLSSLDFPPEIESIAMSDRPDYEYGSPVCYQIPDGEQSAYSRAAEFINKRGYDVLSVQHEYGIFGGEARQLLDEPGA